MELGLPHGSLVLLDTSSLVYLLEGPPRRATVVEAFLDAAARGELRLVASTLAWAELLAGPLAARDDERAIRARGFLADSSRVVLVPVDVAIAEEAARLMGPSRKTPRAPAMADAIHMATALVMGADAVLTNDEDWKDAMRDSVPAKRQGGKKGGTAGRLLVLIVDELAFEG